MTDNDRIVPPLSDLTGELRDLAKSNLWGAGTFADTWGGLVATIASALDPLSEAFKSLGAAIETLYTWVEPPLDLRLPAREEVAIVVGNQLRLANAAFDAAIDRLGMGATA